MSPAAGATVASAWTSPPGRRARALWAALLGATAVAGLLPHLRLPVTPDVSWLLDAAGRMLDGAVLGRDVVEINPPLILWIKQLVVAGARAAGVHPERAWVVTMLLLGALSSWLAARCLVRSESWRNWPVWLLAAVPTVMLVLIPRQDFGQREHLAVLLTLPFLALRGAPDMRRPSVACAAAIGAAAGVGFCLKPFFLLVPLLLFFADARRMSLATASRLPEWLALAAVPLLYVVSVLLWAREWLAYAEALAPLYREYLDAPYWLVSLLGQGAYPGWVFVVGWLVLRRTPTAHAPLLASLGLAATGFQLAAVLQGKGWTYHFLPAAMLGSLAAVLLAHRIRERRRPERILIAGMLVTSAVLAGRGITDGVRVAAGRDVRRGHLDPNLAALTAALRSLGGSASVAVLSSNVGSAFPLLPAAGRRSAFRGASLWALTLDEVTTPGPDGVRRCAPWGTAAGMHSFVRELNEDLARGEPGVLILLEPDASVTTWGGARRIDYRSCLAPGLLERYALTAEVGPYALYVRR